MSDLQLSPQDEAMLAGEHGLATQMAMRILTTMASVYDAPRLLDIASAHIDGCLYHGVSGIEFAQRLVDGGAQVIVPTTLNVGAIDLLHPEEFQGTAVLAQRAQTLMQLYEQMGCQPVYTCAPYQAIQRPPFGAQIAWAESNAIVFANSVLGARTNRYGDFIDICAAITGRAPASGLHLSPNRRGQLLYRLVDLPEKLLREDVFFPVLGYLIGARSGSKIPLLRACPWKQLKISSKRWGRPRLHLAQSLFSTPSESHRKHLTSLMPFRAASPSKLLTSLWTTCGKPWGI